MECVTTASYSIVLNKRFKGFFLGRKGLRQGDPLSPLLFVLCVEYLSRLIRSIQNKNDFKFHPKCESLGITHLAFVDDLMMFSRGDLASINYLLNCLNEFSCCSGLTVNLNKSNLYLAGMKGSDLDEVLRFSSMKLGDFPFRYLGIPLLSTRLNSVHYRPLIDNISNLLRCWPSHTLSYAGRLKIINSVVQGMECFWLAIFRFL
ncbi:uncharacterized mitochondrial protein AtMg01250-like [Malania oleifera]|uniref:uncharacterized mitochondrial protein AtMg01250-like n=1 Tax=Malania oleifera TaxID=397392 RepID=UPI0025AE6FD6|nr:uncharacterized mitochondrial protein AtMg01250-like [Malania oleifera]